MTTIYVLFLVQVVTYRLADQYLNVTAVVDMGSDQYRYQGNVVFKKGFNPLSKRGVKEIADAALVWYKMKLIENNACN